MVMAGRAIHGEEIQALRACVDAVKLEPSVSQYLLQIVHATREHPSIRLGVSTRGTLLYARIARACGYSSRT